MTAADGYVGCSLYHRYARTHARANALIRAGRQTRQPPNTASPPWGLNRKATPVATWFCS
jgi:hypothetical protein